MLFLVTHFIATIQQAQGTCPEVSEWTCPSPASQGWDRASGSATQLNPVEDQMKGENGFIFPKNPNSPHTHWIIVHPSTSALALSCIHQPRCVCICSTRTVCGGQDRGHGASPALELFVWWHCMTVPGFLLPLNKGVP